MKHPLLYEINTRCWLQELAQAHGAPVTLADVPEAEFNRWQTLGFTHIWLMGVWPAGPRSRAVTLQSPELRKAFDTALPGWHAEDVAGSPYAVAAYEVAPALGGEPALQSFRQRLQAHGLKLVLDFVSNHVGLDHSWVAARPELFVRSATHQPETFQQATTQGVAEFAYGKDPYFPAWTDTVQLDYRNPDTRRAMLDVLASVAGRCDGVRCDMAMLALNEVFAQTWGAFPGHAAPATEFWAEAIAAIRARFSGFLFLGEVYWDLEAKLQSLGFDHTYDKRLYDDIVERRTAEVQRHLLDAPPGWVPASAHFLENHDEPRIASRLAPAELPAATLLILGLPGLRFLHDGQLSGAALHTPVQLARRAREAPDAAVAQMHQRMLAALALTAVGAGEAALLRPRAAWAGNRSGQDFVLVQWQARPREFDLVVVNLAPQRGQCYAPLSVGGLSEHNWSLRDVLGEERHKRFGNDLQAQGLYLDVPAHGAQVFHFEPI